jgi:hypothetical protein
VLFVLLVVVQPAGAAQSLQCTLEVQVLMTKASRRGGSASSWVTVWQCQVLFTDDAARIRELQVRWSLPLTYECPRAAMRISTLVKVHVATPNCFHDCLYACQLIVCMRHQKMLWSAVSIAASCASLKCALLASYCSH